MKLFTKMLLTTVLAFPMLLSATEAPKDQGQAKFHDPYADPDARTYEGISEGDYLPVQEEEIATPDFTQKEWDEATQNKTAPKEGDSSAGR